VRLGIPGEDSLTCGTQRFGIRAPFPCNCRALDLGKYGVGRSCERVMQRRGHYTMIGRASVGLAHIGLIEHITECLPIVHLGIQTA